MLKMIQMLNPLLFLMTACSMSSGRSMGRPYVPELANAEASAGETSGSVSKASQAVRIVEGDSDPRKSVILEDGQDSVAQPSIYDAPSFRKRLEESYLSETEIEPKIDADEREAMMDIMGLVQSERFLEAVVLLEENLGESKSPVFDFTLANIRFQQEELEQAVASYESAILKFPKFRRAWENLAQIHYRRGEFKKAVRALTRVVEYGGSNGMVFGLLGVSHSRLGHDIAAESAFRMAMMFEPENQNWKIGMADSFFRQRRYADAASLFGALIKEDPDTARLWLAQGEAFARMGDTLSAAENFEIVDRLGGSSVESLQNLGDIYANEKLFGLAVSAYLRALEKKPDARLGRVLRAAKFLLGNAALDEAEMLIEGVTATLGPKIAKQDKQDLLKLRARLALARGAGADEARILEEVVKLDPLDGDALILLGRFYARQREFEKAAFHFERAANITGFEAMAKLSHARMLAGQRKYADALPMLERVQELKPMDSIERFLKQVKSRVRAGRQ